MQMKEHKKHEEPFESILEKLVLEGKLQRIVRKGETHYKITKLTRDNFIRGAQDERDEKAES